LQHDADAPRLSLSEETLKPDETPTIAQEPKPSLPSTKESEGSKKPDGFISDTHKASKKGDIKSVVFLLTKDKSLVTKKDLWNMF
jgi:hypothetical protein